MKRVLSHFNIALRAAMELGIVLGLGWWGHQAATAPAAKLALTLGAPAVVFGFWGMVDFRQAGRFSEGLRLVQELVLSFLASAALYAAGQGMLGVALALLSVVHHLLVYALGERLLKR